MGRHHVKKKNKKGQRHVKDEIIKDKMQDLDQFAGSSEEENEDEDDDTPQNHQPPPSSDDDTNEEESDEDDDAVEPDQENEKDVSEGDDDGNDDEESIDENEEVDDEDLLKLEKGEIDAPSNSNRAVAMSAVMSRILGGAVASSDGKKDEINVVLSKTVTKLQKVQDEELKLEKELRDKRKRKRAEHLSAMHIPLAPTSSMGAGLNIGTEIQQEKSHRRVATRGVVALFNAIAKHQNGAANTSNATAKKSSKQTDDKKNSTKKGFLDQIRESAVTADTLKDKKDETKTISRAKQRSASDATTWSALKDDDLDKKVKIGGHWDESSSSSDEEVVEDFSDDDEM